MQRSLRCALERQHERSSLIEEKDNYYGVFDHLVEGIFRTTPDGHYLLANIALARIYGYESPVELMASITDIARGLYVDPGRREEFVRSMQAKDTLTGFESKIYRKDGSIIWISENCRAVRNPQGRLLYYEGTVEDITQRQKMEQELRNSESLYHSLVETMPQNMFRKDLLGRFTFANQQYCNHYHCQLGDIIGKTDFDFFPKELAEKYQQDDQQVIRTGRTFEITEEHHPLGQEKTIVRVVKTPAPRRRRQHHRLAGHLLGHHGTAARGREDPPGQRRAVPQPRGIAREKPAHGGQPPHGARNPDRHAAAAISRLPARTCAPAQSAFQFTHRYHPAEAVSGDFFSVSALSETEVGVFICDVAGHGVRAALVTAMIRALAEELKPLARDPGQFLRKLNSDLCAILKTTGSPMLTTAFYLVADWQTGRLRFSNAGHPKPLLIRRAQASVEPLANDSGRSQPALGLFEDPPYQTTETTLEPGDILMLFTDGLYEVQGPDEELYTQQRLLLDVKNLLDLPAGKIFDSLLETIRTFCTDRQFEDDVCLVGMEFTGKPAAPPA